MPVKEKRIARYKFDGHIERECPFCGETKELICYTDTLTGGSSKGCKPCLEEILGIKIVREI